MTEITQFDTAMPAETQNWSTDNAAGRAFAEKLVAEMRAKENPVLLGRVVEKMIAAGQYGGVEVGFCHRLAELAMRE